MLDEIPPFLTVEEAGRLLRIGRTKAYDLAREWRETEGRTGLPVIDFGDLLRVPGPAIRQMLGVGLDAAPPMFIKAAVRSGGPVVLPSAVPSAEPVGASGPEPAACVEPVAPVPVTKQRARRTSSALTDQLPLFEPLPFASPDPEAPSRS